MDENGFDVIVVGGSYAGLSAAMALGRSLKTVLIIDSGAPCNRYTPHSHNFITQDGEAPAAIAKKALEQVLAYDTVKFISGLAVEGRQIPDGFEIETQTGDIYSSRKLIFATGIRDLLPPIEGFEACWGKSLIHCPYCHGYEFKERNTAILANGEKAFHLASLVRNLTNEITIVTGGPADFPEGQRAQLKAHSINILEKKVETIEHQDGQLRALIFDDGSLQNYAVRTQERQRNSIAAFRYH